MGVLDGVIQVIEKDLNHLPPGGRCKDAETVELSSLNGMVWSDWQRDGVLSQCDGDLSVAVGGAGRILDGPVEDFTRSEDRALLSLADTRF